MGAPVNPANRPRRGTPLTFALDQIAAAMAPRPGGRRGLPAPVAVEDFEIVAMGPRPEGRGGVYRPSQPDAVREPQWGRGLKAAEGARCRLGP